MTADERFTSVRLPDEPPQLRPRRAEVLSLLRDAGVALSVRQVADRAELHVNTARFHLDGLVTSGHVERCTQKRATPGRPGILYSVRSDGPGPRNYGLLAQMVTGLVASLDAAGSRATEAGRDWGRHLVQRPLLSERLDAEAAIDRLTEMLDTVGFAPEVTRDGAQVRIGLHHCPFREVAESHAQVVCALHLGLMQGALGELRAPVELEGLQPLVTPQLCLARLQRPEP
jgi:predicted ArsR family transcriptional regulator